MKWAIILCCFLIPLATRQPAAAQTVDGRVSALEEFRSNQNNYNSETERRWQEELGQSERRTTDQLTAIEKEQGQQDVRLASLEKTQTQIYVLCTVLVVLLPTGTTAFFWHLNRRYKQAKDSGDERERHVRMNERRIVELEKAIGKIDSQLDLVLQLGQSVSRALGSELHHPVGHDEADRLLERLDDLQPEEKDRLRELMLEREVDCSVSERERMMARELPVVMGIMENWQQLKPQLTQAREQPNAEASHFRRAS